VEATDSGTQAQTASEQISIAIALQTQTISFGAIAKQTVGTTLALNAAASSGLPVTYASSSGAICTVTGNSASFLAAGNCTITASQAGNSTYAAAAPVSQTFSVVTPLRATNPSSLPSGISGASYSANLAADGGTPPYSWSILSGSLPTSLQLAAGGLISGTPDPAGTFTFTVQVTDSGSPAKTAAQQLRLDIASGAPGSLAVTSGSGQSTQINQPFGRAFVVTVKDANGNPVANATVTFTAPSSGASGVFSGGGLVATVQTDAKGVAESPAFSANGTAGSYTVSASAGNAGTATFSVTNIGAGTQPVIPTFTFKGLPAIQAPGTRISNATVELSEASSAAFSGALTLTFAPHAAELPDGYNDAAFVDGSGIRSTAATLTIPAGSTGVPLPLIDPGTVAGDILVALAIAGQTPTTSTISVERAVPIIEANSVQITNVTASGFDVELVATSTTREATNATFTFAASAGDQISGATTFSVDLASSSSAWFSSSSGLSDGGAFSLTVPFTLMGSASAIQSVTVTLANSVGTSVAVTGVQ
jgi:hypothetical protein